ncbi:cytochrome o ubiquinol oxidase subunit IV [Bradyrhizobium sp. HKCCYLS1011]|uniref:cytochrome o ubiquinol oxidase subunit IV n=1 Tax=Bradyrhizobium sp. HKCCYLS1011 TaxID=3420733 RepID=UPI003EC020D2
MSTDVHAEAQVHDHDHGTAGDHSHGTRADLWIGFAASVVLTALPFWLVMSGTLDKQVTALVIMAVAALQVVVHMVYFLHMNTRSEGGWSMMALIFTIIVVVIALSGSLWVMQHLTTNMMPMHEMSPSP